jgi:hypothetical protein
MCVCIIYIYIYIYIYSKKLASRRNSDSHTCMHCWAPIPEFSASSVHTRMYRGSREFGNRSFFLRPTSLRMYVCMYVCVCVLYVFTCECVYVCTFVYMYVCIHIHTYTSTYIQNTLTYIHTQRSWPQEKAPIPQFSTATLPARQGGSGPALQKQSSWSDHQTCGWWWWWWWGGRC